MRILLVKPYGPVRIPLPDVGLGFLAQALLVAGHDVHYLDCNLRARTIKDFCKALEDVRPEVICFKVFTEEMHTVKVYCGKARKILPDVHLVVGGPHPSAKMEDTFSFIPEIDYGIAGEGERALPTLLERIRNGKYGKDAVESISGIACREKPQASCVLLEDLDEVSQVAWQFMPPSTYRTPQGLLTPAQPYAPVCFSRGCPGRCLFCAGGIANGFKVRYRSPGKIISELKLLRDQYGIRSYGIEDPNFTYDMDAAKTILKEIIAADIKLPWNTPSGIRADRLDQELVQLMKTSGCTAVSFGIEAGSQATLGRMGKDLELSTVEKAIRLVREAGIFVGGFFVLGFPGETIKDLRQTIRYACKLDVDIAVFNRLLPVVGAAFFEQIPEMRGLDTPAYYHQHTYQNNCYRPVAISEDQMRNELRRAHIQFYLRPKTLLRLIGHLPSLGLASYASWVFRYMRRILFREADDRRHLPV
jgi:anaerobic magnesium-protoporphyrin IX monomethyl ester cyclase